MILVTGGTGFIGSRLIKRLLAEGEGVRVLVRSQGLAGCDSVIGTLENEDALARACQGVETLFHCAGHAHAFAALGKEETLHHWEINFEGTRRLVTAAARAGVRHFIFLSSVKAQAEPGDVCADEEFPGEPETVYGQAKRAAEVVVCEAGRLHGMHVVNLRLSMVYGAGGRGNLERMGRLVARGLFPPLPETGNRRSLVHVDDVVAAMRLVADDPRAGGGTYIVASQEAPSGRQLFDALRAAQGMPPCRWAVPAPLLRLAGHVGDGLQEVMHRRMPLDSEVVARLLGSAWYSPARIERELGWQARTSLAEGLKEMLGA